MLSRCLSWLTLACPAYRRVALALAADEPPDLSTSAEQLAALNIKATRGTAAKGSSSGSSSGGSGSGSGTRVAPSKPKTGMMRGFFDAKPKAKPARRAASKEGPTEVRNTVSPRGLNTSSVFFLTFSRACLFCLALRLAGARCAGRVR